MQENPKTDDRSSVSQPAAKAGLDRRSLIRAGLAGAPVLMGLTSKSAMAGTTHVTCSVWSSFKASSKGCLSAAAPAGGSTCKGYNHWVGQSNYPNFCTDYRNSRFHSLSGKYCPPFSNSNKNYGTTKNLREIFQLGDSNKVDRLAKHCAALYLSACESSASSPLSKETCKTVWSSVSAGGGTGKWKPYVGGPDWGIDECLAYFDYVCGVTNLGTIPVCK